MKRRDNDGTRIVPQTNYLSFHFEPSKKWFRKMPGLLMNIFRIFDVCLTHLLSFFSQLKRRRQLLKSLTLRAMASLEEGRGYGSLPLKAPSIVQAPRRKAMLAVVAGLCGVCAIAFVVANSRQVCPHPISTNWKGGLAAATTPASCDGCLPAAY